MADDNQGNWQGEWDDWDNEDNRMDDESLEEDDASSALRAMELFAQAQKAQGMLPKNTSEESTVKDAGEAKSSTGGQDNKWDAFSGGSPLISMGVDSGSDWGFSEETPYFDEDDVQDDEGNWGRTDEDKDFSEVRNIPKATTSIWEKSYSPNGGR